MTEKFYEHALIAVADLVPYAMNSRTHSDAQVAQIAASIREFGFTNPVLIDEANNLIAGHGRVLAARKLKMELVPAIVVTGLDENRRRALVIADNQLALNAEWDQEKLIAELQSMSVDMQKLTGFSEDELLAMLKPAEIEGLTDEDAVPEAPADPITQPGDVWLLGKHRIVCGDSTDADTVAKALNGVLPHLMVTDPPYGVEYDPDWRNRVDRANGKPYGASAIGMVANDSQADWREAWALFPGDVAYVWCAPGALSAQVCLSLDACGLIPKHQIIWAKNQLVIGRGHYHQQHECCWYAVRKGGTGHWHGDRKQTTLWQIDKPRKSETGHSTQKPVECMARPIRNNSSPGQAVYEPFSGSGTTIIACEMEGRICHAIELNPAYVDVAVKRWQDFTGETAILEGDGRIYDQLKQEREAA
jgi:DNA modification methylase